MELAAPATPTIITATVITLAARPTGIPAAITVSAAVPTAAAMAGASAEATEAGTAERLRPGSVTHFSARWTPAPQPPGLC